MSEKSERRFFFEVDLDWLADTRGILRAAHAEGTLKVATPPVFGGSGKPWTPEHFFISAICSCYMTTLLAFARKSGMEITRFDCHGIGEVGIVEGRYKFIKIDIYPKITVAPELEEKARQVIEKTQRYCLISSSVNAEIFYHTQLLTGSPGITNPAD